MFDIGLYRAKHGTIFLPKTIRPRALIFCIWHDLVDLYQVGSSYAPEDKMPPRWSHVLHRLI